MSADRGPIHAPSLAAILATGTLAALAATAYVAAILTGVFA